MWVLGAQSSQLFKSRRRFHFICNSGLQGMGSWPQVDMQQQSGSWLPPHCPGRIVGRWLGQVPGAGYLSDTMVFKGPCLLPIFATEW
mmetsp:Transcript_8736/g.15608  ORF Transcript_8736/g.15608 Transcript_8736/m.15608 type:complete len:87 (+) Transcript_8736:145-405(+)